MPALTVGLIAAPPALTDRLAASIRQGAWTALGLSLAAGMHWMAGGSASVLADAKRRDAAARQVIARDALADMRIVGDPHAYHLWLELPDTWRAEAYAAAALRQGIALLPASAFAVNPGHAPNAVRLALASPAPADLDRALRRLRRLAFAGDDQVIE
jgi:DNA-binding transcriptional MocR family regulator